MTKTCISALVLLFGLGAIAVQTKALRNDQCAPTLSKFSEATQQVVNLFLDLSRIPRGSGKEKQIRDYIISLARKTGHEFETDATGNLTIDVPGTGEFEGQNQNSIALQSHLDMVLFIPGASRMSDVAKAFHKGVPKIVFDGDNVHTGGVSTLGADNGIGVATALRFLLDKNISHPRLRLLFTVEEETTFRGARAMKIPKDVRAIINLDMEQIDQITIGCQGACRWTAEYETPVEKVPRNTRQLTANIAGFAGGHSGIDIHKNRGNVARLTLDFLLHATHRFPSLQIARINSGIEGIFNKIPDSASVDLAINENDYPMFKALFNRQIGLWQKQFGSEARPQGKLSPSSHRFNFAASRQEFKNLAQLFLLVQDGPILAGEGLPNDWNLTSNQAFLNLSVNSKESNLSFGVMSRAYEREPLHMFVQASVLQARQDPHRKEIKVVHEFPPWTPQPNSPLIPLITQAMKESGVTVVNVGVVAGGLETAAFADRYPDLPIVSIGPNIFDVHSPAERFTLSSMEQFLAVLDKVVHSTGQLFSDNP